MVIIMKKLLTSIITISFIALLMPLFLLSSEASVTFAGGDGTADNPYMVSTPEQLNEVRNYISKNFVQINDIDMSAATSEGGIFYNGGNGWQPMANSSVYDGGGYRIIGLQIKRSEAYAGLFSQNNGVIKNLGVVDSEIINSSSPSYVGGIAGYNKGTIIDCCFSGNVSSFVSSSAAAYSYCYAGGITGYNERTISNCYNTGSVASYNMSSYYNSSPSYYTNAYSYSGGIAGYNNSSQAIISNSYNMGEVAAKAEGASANSVYSLPYSGGIVGYSHNGGSISDCYSEGTISASSQSYFTNAAYVGGISGYSVLASNSFMSENCIQIVNGVPREKEGIKGVGQGNQTIIQKTCNEMSSADFVLLLNQNNPDDVWHYDFFGINNGFPVLGHQSGATAVVPSVSPGTHVNPFYLSLSSGLPDSEIYYTLDGTNPKTSDTRIKYAGQIHITNRSTAVKAYAAAPKGNGVTSTFNYIIAQWPVSVNVEPGVRNAPFLLMLSCDLSAAEIYYTNDGGDPAIKGQKYTGPIFIDKTTTISAIVKRDGEFGDAVSFNYIVSPMINADYPSGQYDEPFTVALSNSLEPSYKLYYTTDGSNPKYSGTEYTGEIVIFKTTVLKVAATFEGAWSEIETFVYTLPEAVVAVSQESGSYDDVFFLTLECNLPYYDIYTNRNGEYEKYTAPFAIYKSTDLSVQLRYGEEIVRSAAYNYSLPLLQISNSMSPGSYSSIITIDLCCNIPGYQLYYSLDGSEPNVLYSVPFELDKSAAIKVEARYEANVIQTVSYSYTLNLPYATASVGSGKLYEAFDVELVASNPFYDVYYTLDGSSPKSSEAALYATGTAIHIDKDTVLKLAPCFDGVYGTTATYEYSFYKYYSLNLTADKGGAVTGAAGESILEGVAVTLNAVPEKGYVFAFWVEDGIALDDNSKNPLSFTMPENDVNISAVFSEVLPPPPPGSNSVLLAPVEQADAGVIEIDTVEKLAKIGNDDSYPLDGSYILTADIDLSTYNGGEWIPIGYTFGDTGNPKAFTGVFDGYGYVIKNMKLTGNNYYRLGLFSNVSGVNAVIKNVALEGTIINVSGNNNYLYYAGAIAAEYSGKPLYNCYNTGSVHLKANSNSAVNVGGLVGYMRGDAFNCYNKSKVSGEGSNTTIRLGGISGYAVYQASDTPCSYTKCYNSGEIIIYGDSVIHANAGGIIGASESVTNVILSNCMNTGEVKLASRGKGTTAEYASLGGIVGECHGSISDCYNKGNIVCETTSTLSEYVACGGIAGYFFSSIIENCYNSGDILAKGVAAQAGGIVGQSFATITIRNCVVLASNISASGSGSSSYANVLGRYFKSEGSNKYLQGITGNAYLGLQYDGAQVITLAQANDFASYSAIAWDFKNIWSINPTKNDGYPYFKWEEENATYISGYDGKNVSVFSSDEHINVAVWVANYTNGRLINLQSRVVDLLPGTTTAVPISASTSGVKVFVIRNDGSMQPLCEPWIP